jgi:REP element-mobilizing transposase RayT
MMQQTKPNKNGEPHDGRPQGTPLRVTPIGKSMDDGHNQTSRQRELPQRKSIRLKGYDYSQAGLYFITVCTQDRLCLFGKIQNGEMILNDSGNMIQRQWVALPERFHNIAIHEFAIMPNHFHGIVGASLVGARSLVNARPLEGTRNHESIPNVETANDATIQKIRENHDGQPHTRAPTRGAPTVYTHNRGSSNDRAPTRVAPTTVGDVVGAFKSLTTHDYIQNIKKNDWQPFNKKLWQRNYYEHIIRDEKSYDQISEYIQTNPLKWQDDQYYA